MTVTEAVMLWCVGAAALALLAFLTACGRVD